MFAISLSQSAILLFFFCNFWFLHAFDCGVCANSVIESKSTDERTVNGGRINQSSTVETDSAINSISRISTDPCAQLRAKLQLQTDFNWKGRVLCTHRVYGSYRVEGQWSKSKTSGRTEFSAPELGALTRNTLIELPHTFELALAAALQTFNRAQIGPHKSMPSP